MTELVEWFEDVLTEQEQVARAASPGPWRHNPSKYWRKPGTNWKEEAVFSGESGAKATCIAGTGDLDDLQSMADAAHIALHDPAAVLADIASKRAILAIHAPWVYGGGFTACSSCEDGKQGDIGWPCRTVRAMGSAFAHCAGYLSEWAPT